MKTTTQNKPTAEADLQWYEEQIQLGLDDLEAGRVLTQEEMRAAVEKELATIAARHAKSKKAA
jgi:predicted transcriptional regulator